MCEKSLCVQVALHVTVGATKVMKPNNLRLGTIWAAQLNIFKTKIHFLRKGLERWLIFFSQKYLYDMECFRWEIIRYKFVFNKGKVPLSVFVQISRGGHLISLLCSRAIPRRSTSLCTQTLQQLYWHFFLVGWPQTYGILSCWKMSSHNEAGAP